MTVAELRKALTAKGIKTTTRMRKAELEALLHNTNLVEVVKASNPPDGKPRSAPVDDHDYASGGNVPSIRAFRRRQPDARDRQRRRRRMRHIARMNGEDVCMNPGTRSPERMERRRRGQRA